MNIVLATYNEHKVQEIQAYLKQFLPDITLLSLANAGIEDEIHENGNTFESNAYLKASTAASLTQCPVIADDSGLVVDFYTDLVQYYKKHYSINSFINLINCIENNENIRTNVCNFWKQYFDKIIDVPGIYSKRFGNLSTGTQQNNHVLSFFSFFTQLYDAFSKNKLRFFLKNHNTFFRKDDCEALTNFIQSHALHYAAHFVSTIAYIDASTSFITRGTVSGVIHTKSEGTNGFGYDPIFYCTKLSKTFAQLSFEEKNTISHRALALKEFVVKYRTPVK